MWNLIGIYLSTSEIFNGRWCKWERERSRGLDWNKIQRNENKRGKKSERKKQIDGVEDIVSHIECVFHVRDSVWADRRTYDLCSKICVC